MNYTLYKSKKSFMFLVASSFLAALLFLAAPVSAPVSAAVAAPVSESVAAPAAKTQAMSPELSSAVDKMQDYYKNLKSMSATFTQTFTHKETASQDKRTGTLDFKKPMLVRWDVKGKEHELLVITKKEVWDYLEGEEVAYRYSLDLVKDSNSFIKVITGQANVRENFKVTLEGKENGVFKLHLYPNDPTSDLTEALLWIDSSTGAIKHATIYDFYGNTNDVVFDSFNLNKNLPDSTFSFTAPKGVEVEDRIEKSTKGSEKPLFQ